MAEALCLLRPILLGLSHLIKKTSCNSLTAVVIPKRCGKTTFINSISAKDTLLLDLEENITLEMSKDEKDKLNSLVGNSSYNLHYFPMCRDYLNKVKLNHKFKQIVVFCSDMELVKYLGIKKVYTFIPSNNLTKVLGESLTEAEKEKFETSRLTLLLATKKIVAFNDFGELSKFIINKFKLEQKL